jgi:proteasome-associated ATPase
MEISLKAGDEVRVDPNFRVALEVLAHPQSREHYLDDVPELPWEKVGGQELALQAIKDAIELPLIHGELFIGPQHATPKGFGYGARLREAHRQGDRLQPDEEASRKIRRGNEGILHARQRAGDFNMWVGESERIVREFLRPRASGGKGSSISFHR